MTAGLQVAVGHLGQPLLLLPGHLDLFPGTIGLARSFEVAFVVVGSLLRVRMAVRG